jgi:hypothetical protein
MSIRDAAETNREKQEARTAERHTKEADARPDAMHRAVHFLLIQAKANNRDCTREANHHIATLDAEYGEPQKLDEVGEALPEANPVATAAEAAEPIPAAAAPARRNAPTDTAKALRTSKRFRRDG